MCSSNAIYLHYMLGLGDIFVPGLSLNYAILFDIASKNRIKIYFIANFFGN